MLNTCHPPSVSGKNEAKSFLQLARRCCLIPVHLFVILAVFDVHAVELGDIRLHSWLGRQLKASVPLIGDDARASRQECFKGVLLNLNHDPVSTLKVMLQHSAKESVLLLAGGYAVDEPAAMVRVENSCGTGAHREYAVLLDLVPESQAMPPVPAATSLADVARDDAAAAPASTPRPVQRTEAALRALQAASQRPKTLAQPDIISLATGMMKMTATLMHSNDGRDRHAPLPSSEHQAMPTDTSFGPALALARSLAKPASASREGNLHRTTTIAGALALLFAVAAAIWIVMRVRQMNATAKPWNPGDLQSGSCAQNPMPDSSLPS